MPEAALQAKHKYNKKLFIAFKMASCCSSINFPKGQIYETKRQKIFIKSLIVNVWMSGSIKK